MPVTALCKWINFICLTVVNVELLAIEEIKELILKFNELKHEFLSELKDQIKKKVSEAIKIEIKRCEELESTVSLLQEHVEEFQKQVSVLIKLEMFPVRV